MQKIIVISLCVFLHTTVLLPSNTTSSAYLRNALGARPVSMGEAFAGFNDDINGVFYNPASLSSANRYSFLFSHIEFIQGVRYELLSALIPFEDSTSAAVSMIYVNNGSQERRDTYGNLTGEFTPYQIVPVVSFAKGLTETFALGANLKIPNEVIDEYSVLKVLFDVAGFLKLSRKYSLGINVQNIGTYENLPLNLKLGVGYRDSFWNVAFDINVPYKSSVVINIGSEIKIFDNFFLRDGLRYKFDTKFDFISNFTAGFGYKIDVFNLDYGFKMYDDLGNTHFISLIVNLN